MAGTDTRIPSSRSSSSTALAAVVVAAVMTKGSGSALPADSTDVVAKDSSVSGG